MMLMGREHKFILAVVVPGNVSVAREGGPKQPFTRTRHINIVGEVILKQRDVYYYSSSSIALCGTTCSAHIHLQ